MVWIPRLLRTCSVVVAALVGEAMPLCRIIGRLLALCSTAVVLHIARRASLAVKWCGSFKLMFVLTTVLMAKKTQVGLEFETVAIVLRRCLGILIIPFM